MAKRSISIIGETVLRQKARRVRDFDTQLHQLLDDMVETMIDAEGIGLAAPQTGVSRRVIVVRLPDNEEEYGEEAGKLYEVVNPEIIKHSRETVEGVEACLSIPGYFGTVDRHVAVVVRGQDRNGKSLRIKAYDWHARVFQHEIDHLNGVLFVDLAKELWKAGEEPSPEGDTEEVATP